MTAITLEVVPLQNAPRRRNRNRATNIARRLTKEAASTRPMVIVFTEALWPEVLQGIREGLPDGYELAHRAENRNSVALAWDTRQVRVVKDKLGKHIGGHFLLHGPVWGGIVSRERWATWRLLEVIETRERFIPLAYHPCPSGKRRGLPAIKAAKKAQAQAHSRIWLFIARRKAPIAVLGDFNDKRVVFGYLHVAAEGDPIIRADFAGGRVAEWEDVEAETHDQDGSDHKRLSVVARLVKKLGA